MRPDDSIAACRRVPGYGVWMWNVAVVRPCSIAQSTVRANTSSPSSSIPNTKLPLIIMPSACKRPAPRLRGPFDGIAAQHAVHGGRALEQTAHPPHAVEERPGEAWIAEQVIVEEVQVPAGKTIDFREGVIHALRVERSTAFEERVF